VVRINAERIQILTMLQEGKISVPEAERLLEAISTGGRQREEERILRLRITEQGRVMANVRIPFGLVESVSTALSSAGQAGIPWQSILSKVQAGIGGKLVEVEEPNQDRKVEILVE
jgi:hypothetical protein